MGRRSTIFWPGLFVDLHSVQLPSGQPTHETSAIPNLLDHTTLSCHQGPSYHSANRNFCWSGLNAIFSLHPSRMLRKFDQHCHSRAMLAVWYMTYGHIKLRGWYRSQSAHLKWTRRTLRKFLARISCWSLPTLTTLFQRIHLLPTSRLSNNLRTGYPIHVKQGLAYQIALPFSTCLLDVVYDY